MRGWRGLLVVIFSVVLVVVTVLIYYETEKRKVLSTRDNRMDSFTVSKGLAYDVVSLLELSTEDEYLRSREYFKKIMTTSLWEEYFSSTDFSESRKNYTVHVTRVYGSLNTGREHVFKIDFEVKHNLSTRRGSLLVFTRNNIVYKISSLGQT